MRGTALCNGNGTFYPMRSLRCCDTAIALQNARATPAGGDGWRRVQDFALDQAMSSPALA